MGREREQKKTSFVSKYNSWRKIQNALRGWTHEKLLLVRFQKTVLVRTFCRTHPRSACKETHTATYLYKLHTVPREGGGGRTQMAQFPLTA